MTDEPPEEPLQRLDPDRAAGAIPVGRREQPDHGRTAAPQFNPRRYQWMAGGVGLLIVVVLSIIQLTSHGSGTAGIPAGKAIRPFAAPLATSTLVGDANLRPACSEVRHDPRALNVCLLLKRGPLVLGFFVTDSGACERAVSAMQTVSSSSAARGVQFAAVAVHGSRGATAAAVRRHAWTIPVAYDRDGAVGESYGVEVCPLLELVRPDGIVADRLIGKRWGSAPALAGEVRRVLTP